MIAADAPLKERACVWRESRRRKLRRFTQDEFEGAGGLRLCETHGAGLMTLKNSTSQDVYEQHLGYYQQLRFYVAGQNRDLGRLGSLVRVEVDPRNHGQHITFLDDSMTLWGAVAKGRSATRCPNRICKRVAEILLQRGCGEV